MNYDNLVLLIDNSYLAKNKGDKMVNQVNTFLKQYNKKDVYVYIYLFNTDIENLYNLKLEKAELDYDALDFSGKNKLHFCLNKLLEMYKDKSNNLFYVYSFTSIKNRLLENKLDTMKINNNHFIIANKLPETSILVRGDSDKSTKKKKCHRRCSSGEKIDFVHPLKRFNSNHLKQ